MTGFFQPMQIAVLAIMGVMLWLIIRSVGGVIKEATQPKAPTQLWVDPSQPSLKNCTECGKQIARPADKCPLCGGQQFGM